MEWSVWKTQQASAIWLQFLETYNLKVTHRPCYQHRNADALSRNSCKPCKRQEEIDQTSDDSNDERILLIQTMMQVVFAFSQKSKYREQSQDSISNLKGSKKSIDIALLVLGGNTSSAVSRSWYMPLNKIGKSSPRPAAEEISPGSSHLKTLWSRWNRLRVLGRELYRTWEKENVDDQCIKLIVPAAKRIELLKYMHDLPSSAHLGVDKTFESLKNGFYWPGIKEYVKNYCKSCHHCSARKPFRKQNKAPMGNCIVGEPFERIEIDPYQSQNLVIDTYWPCVIVSPSGSHPSTRPDCSYYCQSFSQQFHLLLWMSSPNTLR